MIGRQASFVVTEGELKKWKLSADRAVYNEAQTDAVLTGVQGEFYNRAGEAILRFTAPSGNYVNRNNAVELTGGVIAQSVGEAKGGVKGRLEAPRMVWNAKTDWVTADGGILLSFPEGKSVAQRCRFNLDFSKIALHGNVASTISP
jgi:LPS export ABC transporter protein LptC